MTRLWLLLAPQQQRLPLSPIPARSPSTLSIPCLSSLLRCLPGQCPGLSHPHSKDLERLLFPGQPGWSGDSDFRGASYTQNRVISGPCGHLSFTWRSNLDRQKLSSLEMSQTQTHFLPVLKLHPLLATDLAARQAPDLTYFHLDATACQTSVGFLLRETGGKASLHTQGPELSLMIQPHLSLLPSSSSADCPTRRGSFNNQQFSQLHLYGCVLTRAIRSSIEPS